VKEGDLTRKQLINWLNQRFKKAGLNLKLDPKKWFYKREVLLDMKRQLEK